MAIAISSRKWHPLEPVLRELIEGYLRENRGERDATVEAIYAYMTDLMDRDPQKWAFSAEWLRAQVAAVVDDFLKHRDKKAV